MSLVRAYSRNLGQRLILARKSTFFEKKAQKFSKQLKQLAKQPPPLKTLMQKNVGWALSKKFHFFNFKFIKAKFQHNFFGAT